MPSSSEIIDLPLVTVRAPARAADLQHGRARLVGGAAPMHVPAGALDIGGELLEVEVEVGQRVVLDVAADVAQRSNSGRLATAAVRRAMNCGLLNASAFCSPASARARGRSA